MKKLFTLLTAFFFFSAVSNAQVRISDVAQIIGQQEIMVQRIAQAQFTSMVLPQAKSYVKDVRDGERSFQIAMSELKRFSKLESFQNSLSLVEFEFNDFYQTLEKANTEELRKVVLDKAYAMLETYNQLFDVVKEIALENNLIESYDSCYLELMKLYSYQNALAQHASLYYLAAWNGDKKENLIMASVKTVTKCEMAALEIVELDGMSDKTLRLLKNSCIDWINTERIITNYNNTPRINDLKSVLASTEAMSINANKQFFEFQKMMEAGIVATTEN